MIPNISSKKIPSINLALFINNLSESFSSEHASKSPNSSKSPKFFDGGVVGLGIVAAMNDTLGGVSTAKTSSACKMVVSSKSEPIPIAFTNPVPKYGDSILEGDDMELSESYTCVIYHLGNQNSIRKREYIDAPGDRNGTFGGNSKPRGVFFTSPLKYTEAGSMFQAADFLSYCYLCRKKLHGLDIFMYRGDKAFCSEECRYKQILRNEDRAKCGSGARKSFAYSVSPCSSPGILSAGVVAT